MLGPIEHFMIADHARIDRLLSEAEKSDGTIDFASYAELRSGLLRHIAMEEKVLFPFARAKRDGEPLPIAKRAHADHGEIAKLLVSTPHASLLDALRTLLGRHNAIEEGPQGLYATCDDLADGEAAEVVARLKAQPEVLLAPHCDGPHGERVR